MPDVALPNFPCVCAREGFEVSLRPADKVGDVVHNGVPTPSWAPVILTAKNMDKSNAVRHEIPVNHRSLSFYVRTTRPQVHKPLIVRRPVVNVE